MKIGFVSDVHCNVEGFRKALDVLADCDEVVCAGDLMFQYRFSNELLETLDAAGVRSVLGNHDKSILYLPHHPLRSSPSVESRWLGYLGELPERLTIDRDGVRILVAHGAPWDADRSVDATYVYPHDKHRLQRMAEFEADVVVLGHTHVPMAQRVKDVLVLNPGSCGVPWDESGELTCAALDLATLAAEVRRFAA